MDETVRQHRFSKEEEVLPMPRQKGSKQTKKGLEGLRGSDRFVEEVKRSSTGKGASSDDEAATGVNEVKPGAAKPANQEDKGQRKRKEKAAQPPSEKVEVVMLPVDQLFPNP